VRSLAIAIPVSAKYHGSRAWLSLQTPTCRVQLGRRSAAALFPE
jgi:hypothetical protein